LLVQGDTVHNIPDEDFRLARILIRSFQPQRGGEVDGGAIAVGCEALKRRLAPQCRGEQESGYGSHDLSQCTSKASLLVWVK
jgi:hypothetical protein